MAPDFPCALRAICWALLALVGLYRIGRADQELPDARPLALHPVPSAPPSPLQRRVSTTTRRNATFERAFFINADGSRARRRFMQAIRCVFTSSAAAASICSARLSAQAQLSASGVRSERWPATRGRDPTSNGRRSRFSGDRVVPLAGGPELLRTHAKYFRRGVEEHLYANHSRCGNQFRSTAH